MSNISLPLELEYTIIEHLSGYTSALQSCALVSRSWSEFSQRTLFRHIQVHLYSHDDVTKLLNNLISLPHLQTLLRGLQFYQRVYYDITPFPAHMYCLASLLPLLPNLAKIAFFGDSESDDISESYLQIAMAAHLLGNAPLVELEVDMYSADTFHDVLAILGRSHIKRLILTGRVFSSDEDFDSEVTREHLHLPLIEHIRFGVGGLEQEFHSCLVHRLDLPNLKQCEIIIDSVDSLSCWQDLLLLGFPPLGVFKVELASDFFDDFEDSTSLDVFRIPLAGLPFKHVYANLTWSGGLDTTCRFVMWWSSVLRALSNSEATIRFTELTFSFFEFAEIDSLESACQSLDDSLAHPMFSAVRSVHFDNGTRVFDEAVAEGIRHAFPQLTSRGVLRLV